MEDGILLILLLSVSVPHVVPRNAALFLDYAQKQVRQFFFYFM